jgi:hypothetical protein
MNPELFMYVRILVLDTKIIVAATEGFQGASLKEEAAMMYIYFL